MSATASLERISMEIVNLIEERRHIEECNENISSILKDLRDFDYSGGNTEKVREAGKGISDAREKIQDIEDSLGMRLLSRIEDFGVGIIGFLYEGGKVSVGEEQFLTLENNIPVINGKKLDLEDFYDYLLYVHDKKIRIKFEEK